MWWYYTSIVRGRFKNTCEKGIQLYYRKKLFYPLRLSRLLNIYWLINWIILCTINTRNIFHIKNSIKYLNNPEAMQINNLVISQSRPINVQSKIAFIEFWFQFNETNIIDFNVSKFHQMALQYNSYNRFSFQLYIFIWAKLFYYYYIYKLKKEWIWQYEIYIYIINSYNVYKLAVRRSNQFSNIRS